MNKLLLICLLPLIIFSGCNKVKMADNIIDYEGVECASSSRLFTDVPFCSDVKNCMEDCELVNGTFTKIRYQQEGMGNIKLCFCERNGITDNIW